MIRFSRPWNTCDGEEDYLLNNDTVRVIWAFHEVDPIEPGIPSYHGDNKGSTLIILSGANEGGFVPRTETVLDFTAQSYIIPSDVDTTYFCQMFKVPDYVDRKKQQIVAVSESFAHSHSTGATFGFI